MDAPRASVVSSFMIIKGSMIEETYATFRDWDFDLSREQNLASMKSRNTVGARSENWLRDVYKVLHRRFDPAGRDRPLVELAQRACPLHIWKPLLLWHMTRDEFLVRDFLGGWLYDRFKAGQGRVVTKEVIPYLSGLHRRGLVEKRWTESTTKRVAAALLGMAVDFGLMKGTQVRQFAPSHLPDDATLYLLHAIAEKQPNAREVTHSPDWRLYLMDPPSVERELFRLHQYRRLHYEVAGSLGQLSLPCPTASTFAREMTL